MTDLSTMSPEDRDALIAEYALGTMAGAERTAFETAMARDPALRQAVAAWSERLQPLADSVAPVAPPVPLRAAVLERIGRGKAAERPFSVARWLAWTFGASALAGLAAAALVFLFMPQPPELGGYAMLHDPSGSASVIAFQIDKSNRDMVVLADTPAAEAGHDYELWLLPPDKAPISLGLVKAGERLERPLEPDAATYLKPGITLAISLEPEGGAPAGAPTGPVLYTGLFHLPEKGR